MTDKPTVSWSDSQGRHEIDAKAFVARLTEIDADGWALDDEDQSGMKILSWGDDTTPDETIVAGLVRQGYTSGKGWLLDSDGDLTEDDFDHIASLIEEGYTSGRGPNWTVDLPEAAQRFARVWPADGMVNVRVDRGEAEEVDVSMTAEDIGEEKDLADLLATETAPAP